MKDKTVFDTVTPVLNKYEGIGNQGDTIRKWISVKVDEIASHLNRTHQFSVYTSKNLVDFITLYYEHESRTSER